MEEEWKNLLNSEDNPEGGNTDLDNNKTKSEEGETNSFSAFDEILPKVEKPEGVEDWNEPTERLKAYEKEVISKFKQNLSPEEKALLEARESGADYKEVLVNRQNIEQLESLDITKLTAPQYVALYKILRNEEDDDIAEAAVKALNTSGKLNSELNSLKAKKVTEYKNAIEQSETKFKKDFEAAEAKYSDNLTPFVNKLNSSKVVLGLELTDEDREFAKNLMSVAKGSRDAKGNIITIPKIYELLNNNDNLVTLSLAIKNGLFDGKINLAAKQKANNKEEETPDTENNGTLLDFSNLIKQ